MSLRSTLLTVAIRREILSILATSEFITVPMATARVAASWGARRQLRRESPSSVLGAQAMVFQVGAELVDEVEAQHAAERSAPTPSPRPPSSPGRRHPGSQAVREFPDASPVAASSERETLAEYVTWEVCTQCQVLAAVGWATVGGIARAPGDLCPVEFDCPTGCRIELDELARAYGLPGDGTPRDVAGKHDR